MKIIIMDFEPLTGLVDMIIGDHIGITQDQPAIDEHGLLVDPVIKNLLNKSLYVYAGRKNEIDEDHDVEDKYIEQLSTSVKIDWLTSLDWYEIDYNISTKTLYVKVRQ